MSNETSIVALLLGVSLQEPVVQTEAPPEPATQPQSATDAGAAEPVKDDDARGAEPRQVSSGRGPAGRPAEAPVVHTPAVASHPGQTSVQEREFPSSAIELTFTATWFGLTRAGSSLADNVAGDLRGSLGQLGLSRTTGGSGYFFRYDGGYGFYGDVRSVALGLYPINVGYYVSPWRLMPYVSAGWLVHVLWMKEPSRVGAIGSLRLALGVKRIDLGPFGVSAEVGAGLAARGLFGETAQEDLHTTPKLGGQGTTWDFMLGVGWF